MTEPPTVKHRSFLIDPGESFGAHVHRARLRMGAPQAAIAKRARIAAGYYSELENGKRHAPPDKTAARLVRALDVSGSEAEFLLALATAERCAATVDRSLPSDARQFLACARLEARRLSKAAIDRLFAQLAKEVRM